MEAVKEQDITFGDKTIGTAILYRYPYCTVVKWNENANFLTLLAKKSIEDRSFYNLMVGIDT